ncbi:MAG TPA: hypothetical protein VNW90_16280 [Acetobacteraceae bacterium]|jgi:hypothetical protein|nr:hypothetical protein [Acetobacteraceae bacterium]
MGIDEAIIRYGTAAVLEYGKMSGIEAENVIPEKCLVVFMASRLIDELRWCAKREVSNTVMLKELGHQGDPDLIGDLGGYHTDIAIYDGVTPKAIIEVKKVLSKSDIGCVKRDMEKLQKFTKRVSVPSYLGLLISDNYPTLIDRQLELLKEALDHEVLTDAGARHKDYRTGQWSWRFGCVTLNPPSDALSS